jgi:hypothetical protein
MVAASSGSTPASISVLNAVALLVRCKLVITPGARYWSA